MAYNILVHYRTGDSFNTEDSSESVKTSDYPYTTVLWNNLDKVKESLQRIKDHYLWVESYDNFSEKRLRAPSFVKQNCDKIVRKVCKHKVLEFDAKHYVYLVDDEGKDFKVSAFWIGHFETLYGAEIVNTQDDGWSFQL